MDPHYEQRLRDEVIYLHSLWHQGPPKPTAAAQNHHHHNNHLQPKKSTSFKKEKKPNNKKDQKTPIPDPNLSKWLPSPSPPPSTTTAWGKFQEHPLSSSSLSPKKNSKLVNKNHQVRAFEAVREFFKSKNGDDSDGIDGSDDDDDDGDEMMEEDYGCDDYSFFLKLLMEDDDEGGLKENYVKNFAEGEFSCLVCGALRRGKRFKGCLGLVQHTKTIAKKKRAHRAFGQAVCKVLGWDIDQLPAVGSWLSELKSNELQGNGNGDNCGVVPVTGDIASTKNDEGDLGNGNGDTSGVLPVTGDIASTKNDEGDMGNVDSDVNKGHSMMEYNGVIPGIGAAVSPSHNAVQGDTGNVNICVNNVDSVEGNKVVPDTGAIDSRVHVEGDIENSSLNIDNLNSVAGNNGVEPESAAITSSDNNGGDMVNFTLNVDSLESGVGNNGGVVPESAAITSSDNYGGDMVDFSLNVDSLDSGAGNNGGVVPKSAAITSSDNNEGDKHSWTVPDANKNLESFGTGQIHNTEVSPAEVFTIGPVDENIGVGDEMQVLLNELKEDNA